MTSNVNDKVFQKNLSKVVGPFFLTPGALNHPVISVDLQNNKCSKKDIGIPMMIDVVKFTNDKKKIPEKKSKVYQCHICHRVYIWKYNLTRHLKYECGTQKRFKCWICNKKFPHRQNCLEHMKRLHKMSNKDFDNRITMLINCTSK